MLATVTVNKVGGEYEVKAGGYVAYYAIDTRAGVSRFLHAPTRTDLERVCGAIFDLKEYRGTSLVDLARNA